MNAEERKYNDQADVGSPELDDEGVREKRRVTEIFKEVAEGVLFALFGYLLGICELPFGARPLGMALLCASNRKLPYIFVGVCLSTIGADKPAVALCAYVAALIIRVISRLALDPSRIAEGQNTDMSLSGMLVQIFSENLFLRMATSCVGVFIVALYSLIDSGFLYYDLYGAIIAILVAPTAVFLVNGLFNERVSREDNFRYFSSAVLIFGVIYAARAVTVYGVSIAAFAGMFLTLYVCRKRGIIAGIAVGIICGLAYAPMYAPSFIFAALAAGALWRVSAIFASVSAFSVGFAWGIYTRGIGAISGLMPALLAASLLFAVLDKLFFSAAQTKVKADEEALIECVVGKDSLNVARLDAAEQKIKNLCESFSDMSKFFFELGERMKTPLAGDIKQICDNAFEACCGNCKHKGTCWEENYTDTISAVASISAHVHRDGKIGSENIPRRMRDICERLPDITDEINHNYMLHAKQLLLCDKTEIFALDYEAMSDLLAATMSVEDSEFEYDADMSAALCEALESEELGIRSAVVYGSRKKKIRLEASSESVFHSEKKRIIDIAQKICKTGLACESIESDEEGTGIMSLAEAKRFSVEFAERSQMSKREKSFCGDTVRIFNNKEDSFYSFISDGMGSGRDAALTSGICAMFMQKMLSAGNRPDTSLRMLNGFLRNKGGGSMHECSATIDMLELDLLGGKAAFYKSGAAPTYVFRSGSLFKLRSKTVPVGIIRELDAKKISFDVGDGDVIVMVSDGVTQGKEECPWLFELLKKNIECEGLERTAELIAERASCENGNDDISVVVIKVNAVA